MRQAAFQLNRGVVWNELKSELAAIKKNNKGMPEDESISYARSFCYAVLKELWALTDISQKWSCREIGSNVGELLTIDHELTKKIATYLSVLDFDELNNKTGYIYASLLPDTYRANNGIYYTPAELVNRLIDMLSLQNTDWAAASILDPACGGGAFLVPVCLKILEMPEIKKLTPEGKLKHIENHLTGYEIDYFAGWMTRILLDIAVYDISLKANRRLSNIIETCDTIKTALIMSPGYDVVIGNPPYSRIRLSDEMRTAYKRSLYGHANLYGLFIDAAIRMKKKDGVIGFVAPTSFLGGQYFSNLRKLLSEEAPLMDIDFITARNGVFEEVLQETCLVIFGANPELKVHSRKLVVDKKGIELEDIAEVKLITGTEPWFIPRDASEEPAIRAVKTNPIRMEDYGYRVYTGPLVWNRMKKALRENKEGKAYPVIWAEAVCNNGEFSFDYSKRTLRYIILDEDQKKYMLLDRAAVLLQRTTAKEQSHRLNAAVISDKFIDQYDGVVVENHVNVIKSDGDAFIAPETLAYILNTKAIDRVFRCISGSVAVSATELRALPLPPVIVAKQIEELVKSGMDKERMLNEIECLVSESYNLEV